MASRKSHGARLFDRTERRKASGSGAPSLNGEPAAITPSDRNLPSPPAPQRLFFVTTMPRASVRGVPPAE